MEGGEGGREAGREGGRDTVLPVDFRFFDRYWGKRNRGILSPELKTNQEIDLEIVRARASFPQN